MLKANINIRYTLMGQNIKFKTLRTYTQNKLKGNERYLKFWVSPL